MPYLRQHRDLGKLIHEKDKGRSYEKINKRVAFLAKKYRNLIGCARLDANQLGPAFLQIVFASEHSFRAVKLHPRADRFSPEQAAPLFVEVEREGLAVILHTGHEKDSWVRNWNFIFKRHPKINFILAHGGKDYYRDAIRIAKMRRNVYLETSTLSYYRTGMILKGVGPRKIVFGSDTPYSHIEMERRKLELLIPTARARKLVFSDNAKRILDL